MGLAQPRRWPSGYAHGQLEGFGPFIMLVI